MNFKTIWDAYSKKIESGVVFDISSLSLLFEQHGITVAEITVDGLGNGLSLSCFKIKCSLGVAFFPLVTVRMEKFKDWDSRFILIKRRWEFIDWFIPPYLMMGHINTTLKRTFSYCFGHQERALDEFEYALPLLYTISDMCVFVEQVAPCSYILSKHVNTLRESVLSFYTGYKSAATASLIPIVESALEQLVERLQVKGKHLKDRIESLIGIAIDRVGFFLKPNDAWIDEQYNKQDVICKLDERALMLRIFGDWLKNSFFCNTKGYNKRSGLNRNIFAHGLSLVWQRPTNFHRLMGILDFTMFIEYYMLPDSEVGLFYPTMNAQSNSLFKDVNIRANSQMVFNLLASERTLMEGTKMPVLTNDDSWYLRAARLGDMCMSELVEKLRDKGWHCEVSDPVKEGEFIIVHAKKDTKHLEVALLYCCSTSNDIYKKLESECDVILYLGAPYRQKEYSYGVKKHVGPLQAWVMPN